MKDQGRLILGIILFLPLLLAFSFGHSYLSIKLSLLTDLVQSRPLELSALLAGAVLSGLLIALLFAYPFAALYGRRAVAVAFVASSLAAAWRLMLMGGISSKPFVVATWTLDIICLVVLLPIGVLAVHRLRPNNSFKPKPLRGSA